MHTHTPKTSPDQSRPAPQTLPGPQHRPVQPLVRKRWSDANANQLAPLPVLLGNEGGSAAGSCSQLILQRSLTPIWKNLHRGSWRLLRPSALSPGGGGGGGAAARLLELSYLCEEQSSRLQLRPPAERCHYSSKRRFCSAGEVKWGVMPLIL